MQYNYLGPTGIKVSMISLGPWIYSDTEQTRQFVCDCVKRAWELGINFFDIAEYYGYGKGEVQIGEALRRLGVPREHFVLGTKIFWGEDGNIPNTVGLSRKHIIQGLRKSLKRLNLEYVDIIFCHRPDYQTQMEQTCRALDWVIRKGYAFYWGTSQWDAADIAQAHMICQKYNLIKPVIEQAGYNLLVREKVQLDYRHLLADKKLAVSIFSPLCCGILGGKYNKGFPEDLNYDNNFRISRVLETFLKDKSREKIVKSLGQFQNLAKQLGCSMPQLAIAWTIKNANVTTAITSVTKLSQLQDTVKAIEIRKKLSPQVLNRIQQIFQSAPQGKMDMPKNKTASPWRNESTDQRA